VLVEEPPLKEEEEAQASKAERNMNILMAEDSSG
jgi:hypothetical protein